MISEKQICCVETGFYSTKRYVAELEIIVKKYPNAVLTGEYAFYCHNLTDVIPEKYEIATKVKAAKLLDLGIVPIYIRDDLLLLRVAEKDVNGVTVKIYDRERMPIELLIKSK